MSSDLGLLVLRAVAGTMMAGHGYGKAVDLFAGKTDFPDPIGIGSMPSLVLAVLAELVCALLVVVGFKTRLCAVPVVITMAVAAFVFHAGDPFAERELALLYTAAFGALALGGGGGLSVDGLLGGRRKKKRSPRAR